MRFELPSRRAYVFMGVLCAHLLVIWAFIDALIGGVPSLNSPLIEVSLPIGRPQPVLPPPLPLVHLRTVQPTSTPTAPDLPQPIFDIHVQAPVVLPLVPAAPAVIAATPMALVSNSADNTSFYPMAAIQSGQHGAALVKVCIDAGAHITGISMLKSSSFDQLDAAALVIAQHSVWKTATLGGKPVASCGGYLIQFNLVLLNQGKELDPDNKAP